MIQIEDIKDRKTLEAWVKEQPKDIQRELSLAFSSRSSLRVLPLYWRSNQLWSPTKERTALPILWANVATYTALRQPSARLDAAAVSAAYRSANTAAGADPSNTTYDYGSATKAASAAAEAYKYAKAAEGNAGLIWHSIRMDANSLARGHAIYSVPLWGADQNPFSEAWASVKTYAKNALVLFDQSDVGPHPLGDWTFWIDWYQSVLDGKPMNPDMLLEIVHIRKEGEDYDYLWTKEPAEANRRVMEIYRRYYPLGGTTLSKANVTDFEPNAQLHWMEMVGLPADLDHIRDPDAVQAFIDDIGDLKDRFEDFADYTSELKGQRNIGGVLSRSADKIMDVLRHAEEKDHLKARRLVELGGDLFYWSHEENARSELGDGLCRQLDSALDRLKDVCHRHLGPSIQAMEALNRLELGDKSPDDWVGAIEGALQRIDAANPEELVPLSPDARATLEDMLGDLRLLAAARAEARTDAWKSQTDSRVTRSAGATTATIGKYIERGSAAAKKTGEGMDETIKWFKRWTSMEDMWGWITELLTNAPPPGE